MTDINSTPVTDDLDAFSAELFGTAKPTEKPVEPVAQEEPGDLEPALEEPTEPVDQDADIENEEVDEPVEDDSKLKLKKKQTFQERINELTAKAREAERREQELAKRLEELETKPKAEPKTPTPVETDGPSPTDVDKDGELLYPLGEFDPQYIRDLTRYTIQQETAAAKAAQAEEAKQAQAQAAQQQLQSEWAGKLAEAEKELPDLREKGQNIEQAFAGIDQAYGEYLSAAIMSLDHGPEVLYYLSDNIDEAQRIVAAGPVAATIALGRLDSKFTKTEAPKKKVSEAPEPPAVSTRGAGGRFDVRDDTDDLDAFEKKFFIKK